jgi:hypothetical protein
MRIAIKRTDGGVSIMDLQQGADINAEIEKWETSGFKAISWREIAETDIPADRTFRVALTDNGVQLTHDMPKARDIWRDKMRAARASLFANLDEQLMQALERGQPTAAIAARKQALRDVTADPAIEAAQTLEQLKAVWPAILR